MHGDIAMLHWIRISLPGLLLLQGTAKILAFQFSVTRASHTPSPGQVDLFRDSSSVLRNSNDKEEEDFEIISSSSQEEELPNLDSTEKAWRYAQKPLLSIGAKGATVSHGNSLRQLLDAHTVVKVKVNTSQFGTLEQAFLDIRAKAEEAGAPPGIEMLQARDKDKVILFAMPGTTERLRAGDFPPPPPTPKTPEE